MYIYLYGVLSPETAGTLALADSGLWEDGKIQPNATNIPYTTTNSLGAYALYTAAKPGAQQVRILYSVLTD